MNEKDEVSTKKLAQEADVVDKDNGKQSGKRSRADSLESLEAQSQLKIRKKSPPRNNGEATTNSKMDRTMASATVDKACSTTVGKESDEDMNFDIGNDSVLLDDLLGDFSQETATQDSGCVEVSRNHNSRNQKDAGGTLLKTKNEDETTADSDELLGTEFDGDFDDFFDETVEKDKDECVEGGIDFQEFRYCKVVEIDRENKFLRIKVEQLAEKKIATILCYDFWRHTKIKIGNIVSIKATEKSGKWTIDNNNGFVVTHPHTLVSGTTISGSTFCMRRGILVESFRGLDALPSTEAGESAMTVGTLVHEVLQTVLRKKFCTLVDIRKVANDVINSRRGIQMMYESNLSQRDCKNRVEIYIPKIFDFVKRYVVGDRNQPQDKNFEGKIDRIREIEENVWVPELGLKGKIDVTVEVTVKLNRKIMPLEVKTGQPSYSTEHRGQVVLYNMMLGLIGYKVDAGLLLYIRDNIMTEVKNSRHEERDLIMLRNSFAHYVSRVPESEEIINADGSTGKIWKNMELPEPINHRRGCMNCPYNVICSIYAEKDSTLELSESHILKEIRKQTSDVLTNEHIDYVFNWITMIRLEHASSLDVNDLRDFWTMKPDMRERKGICISNLRCDEIEEEGNRYLHTFVRATDEENSLGVNLCQKTFTESDYIIVSTDTRINVSAGRIRSQNGKKIQILLDRNIVKQNPMANFHLDNYPSSAGFSKINLANVACLLNNHEITNKLRSIIIDKKSATFVEKLPRSVAEIGAPILHSLNKYQREAVLKVLATNDYLLVRGMPGSGKTQTLVTLIDLLVRMGQSVLLTAHTHSAVDNILLKLDERNIDFLRLGSTKRTNAKLLRKCDDVLTAECTTVDDLDAIYNSKNVVGVTCCGANHGLLSKRIFDVCLVDESTQVQQSTALKPLFSAKKFVLFGDPEQLPPVVRNNEARKMGMDESLFTRLGNDDNTVTLKMQYRMNRKIMSIANSITYNGAMKTANDEVANSTLRLTDTMVLDSCERWISRALSTNIDDSVVVLNAGQTFSLREKFDLGDKFNVLDTKRIRNVLEACIIVRLVAVLLKSGVDAKSIGLISPYTAQVELLRSMCQEDIEINTVDQYQGRDKDVILFSGTRSAPVTADAPSKYEILQDRQRLNVALTRAKHKLIVVCDKIALDRYAPFKKLFDVAKEDIINLEPGRDNFTWESLIKLIK